MGTEKKRRRKCEGGLYIIKRKVRNELKQQDEIVEIYQATKEVDHKQLFDLGNIQTDSGLAMLTYSKKTES